MPNIHRVIEYHISEIWHIHFPFGPLVLSKLRFPTVLLTVSSSTFPRVHRFVLENLLFILLSRFLRYVFVTFLFDYLDVSCILSWVLDIWYKFPNFCTFPSSYVEALLKRVLSCLFMSLYSVLFSRSSVKLTQYSSFCISCDICYDFI